MVGDTASLDQDGKPLGGVAQVAMQQGHYAGKLIRRRVTGKKSPKPFRYFDKGNMAVVGKGWAVLESGKVRHTWSSGVAGVGFHSHFVSGSAQSSDQRLPAMGLVIPDRTTRFASHRELSAI